MQVNSSSRWQLEFVVKFVNCFSLTFWPYQVNQDGFLLQADILHAAQVWNLSFWLLYYQSMFVSTNTRWFCSFFHEWIREKPVRKIWWQSQGIPALKFCRPNGNHREKTAILAWKQNFYDVRIHAKVVTFSRGRYNWRAFIFHIKRVFWRFVRIQSDRNQKVKHDILHDLTDQKIQLLRES